MKKLYRKGTVHPSPPITSDHLSFLPAAILTLTAALSPQDKEVLAYLIISSNPPPRRTTTDHPPLFHCSCFRCYMSYWVRWDSSPNHQLIHEIIDSYEDWLASQSNKPAAGGSSKKKDKRNKKKPSDSDSSEAVALASPRVPSDESESSSVGDSSNSKSKSDDVEGGDGVEAEEKGSVRRFVSFIGDKIWGGWGQ